MSITGQINELRDKIAEQEIAIYEFRLLVHDCFRIMENEMVLFDVEGAFQNRDKLIDILRKKK